MNRTGKVAMIGIGGLLAMCLCLALGASLSFWGTGRILSGMVDGDPDTVAEARDAMADYTVPAGFDEGAAISIAGFSMITHTGDDNRSHITLIQEPSWLALDRADLERQVAQASGAEVWTEVKMVDSQPCQIRGQETTLVISEGVSHDNHRYRSASALFEGEHGTVLLSISGPAASWDEEMVQRFVEGIQ